MTERARFTGRLLRPQEQLEEYEAMGCRLTQEEKIDSVEKSISLWVWAFREAECDEICKIMSRMARSTEVCFAFPKDRVRCLVTETLRKIDYAARAADTKEPA